METKIGPFQKISFQSSVHKFLSCTLGVTNLNEFELHEKREPQGRDGRTCSGIRKK